jgi:hypothetical protein
MKRSLSALMFGVILSASLQFLNWEYVTAQGLPGGESLGQLGGLPADLLPKLTGLAHILQQQIAEGKLTEAQIYRELYDGDLARVIRGLGPEASQLLDDISASLKGRQSDESLSALLSTLMGGAVRP